ncbi:MAG: hypothetical protein QOH70_2047 [Blastocatellia bacterium]|nr:hypothetical protein [Blastocatellia bacterium]
MPENLSLDQIRNDLKNLKRDPQDTPFQSLVERLEQILSAENRPLSPEAFEAMIAMIPKMKADVQKGESVQEVVKPERLDGYAQNVGNINKQFQINRDAIFYIFNNWKDEIKVKTPDPSIEIPIVLLVMNELEAKDLATKVGFADYPNDFADEFTRLEELLTDGEMEDWIQRYGSAPENWRPFTDSSENIGQLIAKMLEIVQRDLGYERPLVPTFIDIRTLNKNRIHLIKLRAEGCLIINDVISMRHPVIQQEFRRSLLDAFPSTIIVRVAPLPNTLTVYPPLVALSETFQDLEFYKRRNLDRDNKSFQAFESPDFVNWFIEKAPGLIPLNEREKSAMARHLYPGAATK